MIGRGWNLVYLFIGTMGGLALGWGAHCYFSGALDDAIVMIPLTLIMMVPVFVVSFAKLRQERRERGF